MEKVLFKPAGCVDFHTIADTCSAILELTASCRFENHGFAKFLAGFSFGLSGRVCSSFEWHPNAFRAQ
jgi:hypothetical protein